MSKLRPTLTNSTNPLTVDNGTAYLVIYNAVSTQRGLIHGKLESGSGDFCAIGSYFNRQPNATLRNSLIDEVASVNDSYPHLSRADRKKKVLQWLRWKLKQAGMPGFSKATQPKAE